MTSWFRSDRVECWFCSTSLTLVDSAPVYSVKGKGRPVAVGTPARFECSQCCMVNCRNERGEIQGGDQRGLAETSIKAFQHPSKLPTRYAISPFCSTCTSNQSLQLHMMASFMDEDDEVCLYSYYLKSTFELAF